MTYMQSVYVVNLMLDTLISKVAMKVSIFGQTKFACSHLNCMSANSTKYTHINTQMEVQCKLSQLMNSFKHPVIHAGPQEFSGKEIPASSSRQRPLEPIEPFY
jgi:hypothetical protein